MDSILSQVAERLASEGWQVTREATGLQASRQDIVSRWLLGSRSVSLSLECRFDAAEKVLYYRQSACETAKGLPPPTISFSRTSQHGLHLKEIRSDRSLPQGGGEMCYGDTGWLQALCDQAGWKLEQQIL